MNIRDKIATTIRGNSTEKETLQAIIYVHMYVYAYTITTTVWRVLWLCKLSQWKTGATSNIVFIYQWPFHYVIDSVDY